jgi:18S rRNA (adenine1779-N6/adenine1780-N6)-dimethyltransferase
VNFLEWDGMIRMVFNRKHKTLHAILTVKSILIILEQNYKTYLSLHNTNNNNCSSSSSSSKRTSKSANTSNNNSSNIMIVDEVIDMKSIVEEVLNTTGYSTQRAAKMDINDFLCLLAAFNEKGIHFT